MKRFAPVLLVFVVVILAIIEGGNFTLAPQSFGGWVKARIGASQLEKQIKTAYAKGGLEAIKKQCAKSPMEIHSLYLVCDISVATIYDDQNFAIPMREYEISISVYDRIDDAETAARCRTWNTEFTPYYNAGNGSAYQGVTLGGIMSGHPYVSPIYMNDLVFLPANR